MAFLSTIFASFAEKVTDPSHSSITNTVISTFQQVLNRSPDEAGLTTYVAHLKNGRDSEWLRETLMASDERKEIDKAHRTTFRLFVTVPLLCLVTAILFAVARSRAGPRSATIFTGIVCLIFPTIYYYAVWVYTTNIPYYDDYDTLLAYSNLSISQRVMNLFAQSNEHRIFTARFVTEALRQITGQVNFRHIAIVGNLSIAGLFLTYAYLWKRLRLNTAFLCVISALIFSFAAWKNMVWAIVAVQNNAVQCFSLLAFTLFFSSRRIPIQILALISAALAAFSNGNGLFTFPALLFTLSVQHLFEHRPSSPLFHRRFMIQATLIIVAMLATAIAYFSNYHQPAHHPSLLTGLKEPLACFAFFLRFVGGYFILPWPGLSLASGSLLTLLALYFIFNRRAYANPTLIAMVVFLMITALIAALSRASFGANAAFYPRYRINSVLFICSVLTLLLQNAQTEKGSRIFLACGLFLSWTFFIWHWNEANEYLIRHQRALIDKSIDWYTYGSGLAYHNQFSEHAGTIQQEAVTQGIYTIPEDVLNATRNNWHSHR